MIGSMSLNECQNELKETFDSCKTELQMCKDELWDLHDRKIELKELESLKIELMKEFDEYKTEIQEDFNKSETDLNKNLNECKIEIKENLYTYKTELNTGMCKDELRALHESKLELKDLESLKIDFQKDLDECITDLKEYFNRSVTELRKNMNECKSELDMVFNAMSSLRFKRNAMKILSKIEPINPDDLEDKYCIISFNTENLKKYEKYIRPCVTGRERTKLFQASNHFVVMPNDILNIPKCKVMLVFVDKNETDTILEMPGTTDNDIRLLTVQACLEMNTEVFVVYIGDEGSENLTPGLYCNPQITKITEHPLLKELEADNRVMTCYNSLTYTQQGKIAEFIA